ncbi:hypothetical protein ALC57_05713 [Trachymyrmex cornetzi]|uniref:Uncharacterized protein n=1 Tax=Trachymyrmex cornetzi TaxID=471704 RepID=A0A151JA60_9HYME|nr:hypothetical protein ALC57_05713 [Trachymyrmex cornetzi]
MEIEKFSYKPPYNQTHDRVFDILKLLRLPDHLAKFEKEHVINLITLHSDRFYLPSEYLSKTHVQTHKINTTDNLSDHFKQY